MAREFLEWLDSRRDDEFRKECQASLRRGHVMAVLVDPFVKKLTPLKIQLRDANDGSAVFDQDFKVLLGQDDVRGMCQGATTKILSFLTTPPDPLASVPAAMAIEFTELPCRNMAAFEIKVPKTRKPEVVCGRAVLFRCAVNADFTCAYPKDYFLDEAKKRVTWSLDTGAATLKGALNVNRPTLHKCPKATCLGCEAQAKKACTRCGMARYCGAACQAADWPRHKQTCVVPQV